MIEVRRTTTASPQDVWNVLSDGWSYASWVVGASRVRAVHPDWPGSRSELHHSVGSWPLLLDDHTVVLSATPPSELVMQARGWPLGEARVELFLAPTEDGGCTITMREDASVGAGRYLPRPLRVVAVVPRNNETLRRLCYLAERRSR